eukprot:217260_1
MMSEVFLPGTRLTLNHMAMLAVVFMILRLIFHISALQCTFSNVALPIPVGRTLMGFNNVTSSIYLFGGCVSCQSNNICCQSNIFKWDLKNQSSQWITLSVTTPTNCFWSVSQNSVTVNNTVYFIGVVAGSYSNNAVYVFDLISEQFISDHSIPQPPYVGAMGCLSTNDSHIFMIGGFQTVDNKSSHQYLQILNIKTKQWKTEIIPLDFINNSDGSGWFKQTCVIVHNIIYVFGGAQRTPIGDRRIQGMYKYDTLSSIWSYIGNMSSADLTSTDCGWGIYSPALDIIYFGTINSLIYLVDEVNSYYMNAFYVDTEEIIWSNKYQIPVYSAPLLINNGSIMIFGGNFPFSPEQRVYSSFVQMADILYATPTSSPTTFQPSISPITNDEDSGISASWTIIICINSIVCMFICFLGIKWIKIHERNYQTRYSTELIPITGDTHGDANGHSLTNPRVM